ncbi:glycine receptor subunit alpha-2-like [Ornithodoros turicata]|uniref:glycine receptor subunit alpha-2-like n=1 Tax=Ornithodoros turicata TaxID=34597 RepID=UPI00313880A8
MHLQLSWLDTRLNLRRFGVNWTLSLNGADIVPRMWKPDLFFANVKTASLHDVTMVNQLVDISPDGQVFYSMRLSLELACRMHFDHYPLDTQRCPMHLGPFSQTIDQTVLRWKRDPIVFKKPISVPQYHLDGVTHDRYTRTIETGSFSFLVVRFTVVRQRGYYLITIYFPTMLFVVISWLTFYLHIGMAPGRIILGLGMLLNLVSTNTGVRSEVPPVSYMKALDVWMGGCVCAVFGALFEFTLVHYIGRVKRRPRWFRQIDDGLLWLVKPKPYESDKEDENYDPYDYDELYRNVKRAYSIDRIARVIFPLFYFFFLIVYWTIYAYQFLVDHPVEY